MRFQGPSEPFYARVFPPASLLVPVANAPLHSRTYSCLECFKHMKRTAGGLSRASLVASVRALTTNLPQVNIDESSSGRDY
jgi:hypothetical protein